MPDTPTFDELGFPGFEASTWFSLFAPRGTPPEIIEQLNGYTRSMHDDAEVEKRLASNFVDPLALTTREFADLVKANAVNWERIVRETGAKVE